MFDVRFAIDSDVREARAGTRNLTNVDIDDGMNSATAQTPTSADGDRNEMKTRMHSLWSTLLKSSASYIFASKQLQPQVQTK